MWLEVEFQPLELCKRVETVTEPLIGSGSELEGYVTPVREVTLARLIRQLSQIYETLEYKRLLELASYCKPFHMERVLVDLVRHNDMQVWYMFGFLFIVDYCLGSDIIFYFKTLSLRKIIVHLCVIIIQDFIFNK